MSRFMFAALLSICSLLTALPVAAQNSYRNQIQSIEQEYARQHNGRSIPDDQLEYYIDQSNAGWSMSQISQDMADSQRQYTNNNWRPRDGWVAREVICSSINNQYHECSVPFRGTAVITSQISQSSCIEGQSWGNKAGAVWVNRGCRARFGIQANTRDNRNGNYPRDNDGNYGRGNDNNIIVCQSRRNRYQQCTTGFRGRVQLVRRLNNSAACVSGRSWGQREGMVWVSRGCRAQFASVGRPGRRDDNNHDNNNNWNSDNNYSVTCSSQNNAQVRCNWDARYGTPRMVQQLSSSACVNGRTWGYEGKGVIWVNGGCRAQFASAGRPGRGDDNNYNNNNNWNRDSNYSVTCSSQNSDMHRCNWDSRYGSPRLVQQLSSSACVNGRTWGYESKGVIWVNGGCRARFATR